MIDSVISYNEKSNQWVCTTGQEVCQDHAHVMPCPYLHRIKTMTD